MSASKLAQRDKLITTGFLRYHTKICNILWPNDLGWIVFSFYHFSHEMLRFSSENNYKMQLLNDNKLTKFVPPNNEQISGLICGEHAVYTGINCWRSHINDQNKGVDNDWN